MRMQIFFTQNHGDEPRVLRHHTSCSQEQTRVVRSIIANINSTLEIVQKTQARTSQAILSLYKNIQQNTEKQEELVIRELLYEQATVLNFY